MATRSGSRFSLRRITCHCGNVTVSTPDHLVPFPTSLSTPPRHTVTVTVPYLTWPTFPIVKRQQRASQAGREPAVALPLSLLFLGSRSFFPRPPSRVLLPLLHLAIISPTVTQVDSLQTCSPTSSDGTFPSVASVAFSCHFYPFTFFFFFSSLLKTNTCAHLRVDIVLPILRNVVAFY